MLHYSPVALFPHPLITGIVSFLQTVISIILSTVDGENSGKLKNKHNLYTSSFTNFSELDHNTNGVQIFAQEPPANVDNIAPYTRE